MKKTLIAILVIVNGLAAQESIQQDIIKIEEKLIEWRRDFHKNPELSNREYKTAKKIKRKDWIEDYFLQGAAYANAHNVMYETNIDSIAILMVDRDLLFKEFLVEKKEFDSFTNRWKGRIIEYYKTHEILGRE